ncbi:uncharacterized protein LOC144554840 [Carex rostrata]
MASTCGEIEESDRKESDFESASEEAFNGGREIGVVNIPEAQKSLLKPILSDHEVRCLEIFEVRVSYQGRKPCGKIHGNIYCKYGLDDCDLYRRNKSNAETVSFPGNLTLAGPPVAIRADDPLTMHLDLWHGIDQVSRGFTSVWSLFEWCISDRVITEEVKGRNGAAVVTYAIISNAVVASAEVSLIKGNRKAAARIYGTITASMTGWDVKRVLFCKRRDKYINVDSGAPIPLLRSVLIVPHTSSLDINADLADVFSFPNVPVARGTLQFSPEFYGDFVGTISGKHGEIKVKVTWWSYYNHPDTYKVRARFFDWV